MSHFSLFFVHGFLSCCSSELRVDIGSAATGHCLHSFVLSMQRCCSQAILRPWLTLVWFLEVQCYDFVSLSACALKRRVEVLENAISKQTSSPALVGHREQQVPLLGAILSQFISVPCFPQFILISFSDPVPGITSKILPRCFCDRHGNVFGCCLPSEKFSLSCNS